MVYSQTVINPLGVYLKETGKNVVKVEPSDFFEEKTHLPKDTTNTLLSESAGSNQVLLIHGYEIDSPEDLNLKITANNIDVIGTTELKKTFGEGILIYPNKSFEVTESHQNRAIPIKIKVFAAKYYLD